MLEIKTYLAQQLTKHKYYNKELYVDYLKC